MSIILKMVKEFRPKIIIAEKTISGMESVVKPSQNTMQPVVLKIALSPNQTQVGIENHGKIDDDMVSCILQQVEGSNGHVWGVSGTCSNQCFGG